MDAGIMFVFMFTDFVTLAWDSVIAKYCEWP